MKNGIYYILLLIAGIVIGYLLHRPKEQAQQIVEIVKTITVRDTIEIPEPIPYLLENIDTVYVEVIKDANEPLKVPLIKQRVTYTDSTYKAVVSGYNPKLEYIETYNTTHYITEKVYEKPKKWNLYAGVDVSIMGNTNSLNIGGGISYTKDRWMIDVQVGREILRGDNYIKVGGRYNFMRF